MLQPKRLLLAIQLLWQHQRAMAVSNDLPVSGSGVINLAALNNLSEQTWTGQQYFNYQQLIIGGNGVSGGHQLLSAANGGSIWQMTFPNLNDTVLTVTSYPEIMGGYIDGVNLNSAGDNAITINCPTVNYDLRFIVIFNTGPTASLTTAKYGLFSGTGGGGTAIIGSGTVLSTITGSGVNAATANSVLNGPTVSVYNYTTLYFRVTTPQGASATANVYVRIIPLP